MRRRGYSLVELLVASVVSALAISALAGAMSSALRFNDQAITREDAEAKRINFERDLSKLLKAARITSTTTDNYHYFQSTVNGSSSLNAGADTIVFTAQGLPVSGATMGSTDDFETQNKDNGPQGGSEEISISMTAVGQSSNQGGLILRRQRPADGDTSQGGYEEVFSLSVTAVTFEFWDGTQWAQAWDTRTGQRRLPAAVRVTYKLDGDDADHILIVSLPLSDVTAINPLVVSTGTTG